MLTNSCHLLNTEVESENIMVAWEENYLNVLVVYLGDLMAHEEPPLIATTQHQERVSYCISVAQKKVNIRSSKYDFYSNAHHFRTK